MKDIKQRIAEIIFTKDIQLAAAEQIIEEIIKPLCKDAFEDSRMREEVFNSEGWPELRGYVFKDAKDWLKENLK